MVSWYDLKSGIFFKVIKAKKIENNNKAWLKLNKIKCKWGKSKGKSGWVKAIRTPEIPQKKEILKKNLVLNIKKIATNIEARLHKCNGRVEIKVNLSGYKAG